MEENSNHIESVEKELIENITLKIASCRSDEEFEDAINKYLCLSLTKLSSNYESVRTKILELLVHINKRLKSRPQIQLPVSQLLLQYQDPSANAFVNNFTIIYLKLGIPRIAIEERVKLIPMIIACLEGKVTNHQDSLLLLLMQMLPFISGNKNECKNLFALVDKPDASKLFIDFAFDVLLMPYGYVKPDANSQSPAVPPGLSNSSLKRITSAEPPITPDQLEQVKVAIIKVLTCGAFEPTLITPHLLVASADSRHSLATLGDGELKRYTTEIEWDNIDLLKKLYTLFLGTIVPKDQTKCTVRPEHRRVAANTRIRLKLIPLLLKSPQSASLVIPCIQTIFECLNGNESKSNLKIKGLSLLSHFCTHCPENLFSSVAEILFSELKKLTFKEYSVDDDFKSYQTIRNMALIAIPKIIEKLPSLLKDDLTLVTKLLDLFKDSQIESMLDLKTNVKFVLSDISLTLTKLVQLDPLIQIPLENIIQAYFKFPIPDIREIIVKYAAMVFLPKHVPSKFIILIALGDNNIEVRKTAFDYLNLHESKEKPLFTDLMTFIRENLKDWKDVNISVEMVAYIHTCLEAQLFEEKANLNPEMRYQKLKLFVSNCFEERKENPLMWDNLVLYINWLQNLIFKKSLSTSNLSFFLLELVSSLPKEAIICVFDHPQKIIDEIIQSSERESNETADNLSQLLAILIRDLFSENAQKSIITDLINNLEDNKKSLEKRIASLLASTYILIEKRPNHFELLQKFANILFAIVDNKNSETNLKVNACKAIGQIGKWIDLSNLIDLNFFIKQVSQIIPSANIHIDEAVVLCLSFLTIGLQDLNSTIFHNTIELLLERGSQVAEITFHFTLGEALCCAMTKSTLNFKKICDMNTSPSPKINNQWKIEETNRVFDLILEKYIVHSKKSVANAAVIWSLCLLKHCGKSFKNCSKSLIELQKSTIRVLSNKGAKVEDKTTNTNTSSLTDVIEDVVPKVLKLLFEIADDECKRMLIKDLTLIFNTTGTDINNGSSSLIALKEVYILVNESTQNSQLFYDFLDVISFKLWGSSSKGKLYFDFMNFEAKFRELIAPHYEKILPKLFVAIHDPHSVTRNYMSFLWECITSDLSKNKIVMLNLESILKEISSDLEDSYWKLREAACVALSTVFSLGANTLKDSLQYVIDLYEKLFRVCDDMKETVRIKAEGAVRGLTKAIKQCIPLMDSDVFTRLIPPLVDILQTSVGLLTSAGCCFLLMQLSNQFPNELKPFADKLIKPLLKNLTNRNLSVQKFNADTIGHIIKLLSEDSVETLLLSHRDKYFNDDSRKNRQIVASLLSSMAKHSPDIVKRYSVIILPFSFYCMHETKPSEQSFEESSQNFISLYEEIWSDFTISSESGIKLYSKEILELVSRGFESQLWLVKQQAAKCLTSALEKMGKTSESELINHLLQLLTNSLGGRTWQGKESILTALKTLLIEHKEILKKLLKNNDINLENIIDIMLRECKKENIDYKKVAIISTAEILVNYESVKTHQFYTEILKPLLLNNLDEKNESTEDESDLKNELELCFVSLNALKICWPRVAINLYEDCIDTVLTTFNLGTYKVKQKAIDFLLMIAKENTSEEKDSKFKEYFLLKCQDIIEESLHTTRYPDLQLQALELTQTLLDKFKDPISKNPFRKSLLVVIQTVSSESSNPAVKDKANSVLSKVNIQ
ncbi:proteasome-associated protein ECM29-like protein [Dinothrombium tinctorium]|uniref:Proteasome-associated protein ECM29-like protein n=1 Tax=Dinothrombium tinctorium TaxID=1965070 RepID=A0A3S3PNM0_9ACAR|nr:proteasome-associated protein ECM29-like protein [Dinothrombium tinctorium]